MKELHVISVGKTKDSAILEIEQKYLNRLPVNFINIHEVKAYEENIILEASAIEKKIETIAGSSKYKLILMSENGKNSNSCAFAKWLFDLLEGPTGKVFIIIGGAAGIEKSLYEKSDLLLSLSPLTFPHKIARMILIEQIYRAFTIRNSLPYHK